MVTVTERLAPLWQHGKLCAECGEPRRLPPNSIYCGHCRPSSLTIRAYRRLYLRGLREVRLRQGLTQEHLAKIAGVCSQSISRFERGVHPATERIAHKLAAALMVSVSELERE